MLCALARSQGSIFQGHLSSPALISSRRGSCVEKAVSGIKVQGTLLRSLDSPLTTLMQYL